MGKTTSTDIAAWSALFGGGSLLLFVGALLLLLLRHRRRARAAVEGTASVATGGGGGGAAAPQLRRPKDSGAGGADATWELKNPLATRHAAAAATATATAAAAPPTHATAAAASTPSQHAEGRRGAFQAQHAPKEARAGDGDGGARLRAMSARLIKAHELPPGHDFVEPEVEGGRVVFVDHEGRPGSDPRLDPAVFEGCLIAAQQRGVDLEAWEKTLVS
jgi:hypothetical protein